MTEVKNQVFLDPVSRESWRVLYNGKVCSPDYNSKGAALADIGLLESGYRKPQYSY